MADSVAEQFAESIAERLSAPVAERYSAPSGPESQPAPETDRYRTPAPQRLPAPEPAATPFVAPRAEPARSAESEYIPGSQAAYSEAEYPEYIEQPAEYTEESAEFIEEQPGESRTETEHHMNTAQTRRSPKRLQADSDRWPEEPGDDEYEPNRRRSGRLRMEVQPIVNPYSIVALIGGLVGLFPVAIVFGFISFSHPRGRIMAVFALMLGVAEVTIVAGVLMLSGYSLPHNPFHTDALGTAPTTSPTQPEALAPAPNTTTKTPQTTSAATVSATATKGGTCTDAGLISTDADGNSLLCLQSGNANSWSGPYTVSPTVDQAGSTCSPATDKSARTADNHALVCEGSGHNAAWALWVS